MGLTASAQLLGTGAFGCAILLVALASTLLGKSEWGDGLAVSAGELKKLTPAYWRKLAQGDAAFGVRAPSLIGRSQPVWTPDLLPSTRASHRRDQRPRRPQPMLQAPIVAPSISSSSTIDLPDWLSEDQSFSIAEEPPADLTQGDLSDLWGTSPSPLGRVGV